MSKYIYLYTYTPRLCLINITSSLLPCRTNWEPACLVKYHNIFIINIILFIWENVLSSQKTLLSSMPLRLSKYYLVYLGQDWISVHSWHFPASPGLPDKNVLLYERALTQTWYSRSLKGSGNLSPGSRPRWKTIGWSVWSLIIWNQVNLDQDDLDQRWSGPRWSGPRWSGEWWSMWSLI